jgi:hypothetical protein
LTPPLPHRSALHEPCRREVDIENGMNLVAEISKGLKEAQVTRFRPSLCWIAFVTG